MGTFLFASSELNAPCQRCVNKIDHPPSRGSMVAAPAMPEEASQAALSAIGRTVLISERWAASFSAAAIPNYTARSNPIPPPVKLRSPYLQAAKIAKIPLILSKFSFGRT